MTTKLFTATEYLHNLLSACDPQAKITPNTNVFYYQPLLFTTIMAEHHYALFNNDWFDKVKEYLTNEHASAEKTLLLNQLRYEDLTVMMPAKAFDMQIEVRLFDEQCHKLLEKQIDNINFSHAFPNKGYLTAYKTYQRQHFNGIAFSFPNLKKGRYSFEIVEHYQFNRAAISPECEGKAKFSRKIIIPIVINDHYKYLTSETKILADNGNLTPIEKQLINLYDYREDAILSRRPNLHQSLESKMKLPQSKYASIGRQSIILPLHAIPMLHFNAECGVYDRYAGTLRSLIKPWQGKQFNKKLLGTDDEKQIIAFFRDLCEVPNLDSFAASPTLSVIGCVQNAHFSLGVQPKAGTKEKHYLRILDHNLCGSTFVPMGYLLGDDISPHYLTGVNNPISHGIYDFTELLPTRFLPSQKQQKQLDRELTL